MKLNVLLHCSSYIVIKFQLYINFKRSNDYFWCEAIIFCLDVEVHGLSVSIEICTLLWLCLIIFLFL